MFESTGRRVYVVDDDELTLDMMTNLLEDLGCLTQSFSFCTAFLEAQSVEVHRARIMQRLGVSSFAEMVRVAVLSELHTD